MSNLPPKIEDLDLANVCAEYTRRVQLLTGKFWNGEIDLWHYRKLSRELTQQFVHELTALFDRAIG